jgi:hypothetical protein
VDVAGFAWLVFTTTALGVVLSGMWLIAGNAIARRWARDERPIDCQAESASWRRLLRNARTSSWRRGVFLAVLVGASSALVARNQGWMPALSWGVAFAVAMLTIGLIWGTLGLRQPSRYLFTRRGLAVFSSVLFFPPPYAGGAQVSFAPATFRWESLGPYWWDKGILHIRYRRSVAGHGIVQLPLANDQHRQVQTFIRARGLKHSPEGLVAPKPEEGQAKTKRRKRSR